METEQRGFPWGGAAALAGCLLLAWVGVVRGGPVPLLWLADLGFHELGHLLAAPFPPMVTASAGSTLQVLVPLSLAAYFLVLRRDPVGVGLCLTWAATSAANVAEYIADAPFQQLELLGGEHDWAYILAMRGSLHRAAEIAGTVRTLAFAIAILGVAACAWALLRRPLTPRRWEPATSTVPHLHRLGGMSGLRSMRQRW